MKVLITGSTGMVGKGALLEALDDASVSEVIVVNRSSINMDHSKLKEIILKDFNQLDNVKDQITGCDACFFCMGVSALGLSEEQYTKITYDLTISFAKTFLEVNPASVFIYVTGEGTDSSEKGRTMWARVKGKTENELLKMGFKDAYMFRPGFIQPMRGIKSKTGWYNAIYVILKPFYSILKKLAGDRITNTTDVGKAMIKVVRDGYGEKIIDTRAINAIVG